MSENAVVAGAAGGFVSGLARTGNMEGAVQGALTGAMFGAAGEVPGDASIGRYAAHAAAGCLSAVMASGDCGAGATSAVFGQYATNAMGGITDPIARGVVASVAGGVGSITAGGKFENGAVTAAYAYLFSQAMSRGGDFGANFLGGDAEGAATTNVKNRLILLKPDDPNYQTALGTTPREGEFLIIGHGGEETQLLAGRSPQQMASILKSQTSWQSGQTIRLDSCWMGKTDTGFAQQLSDVLNTTVIASPVRTLDTWFGSMPMYSYASSPAARVAIPIAPAFWKKFIPPGK